MLGLMQVSVVVPVKLLMVNVTGGGWGSALSVTVEMHPPLKLSVTVVVPTGRPVAVSELGPTEPGAGDQLTVGTTVPWPEIATVAEFTELVQPACVIAGLIKTAGQQLIFTVLT
jgi:hypothetical protein